MHGFRHRVLMWKGFALLVACVLTLGGCALADLLGLGSDVEFNTIINGTITYEDDNEPDSNDYYFYWDWYDIQLDGNKSYTLELWTDPDCPIHFKCATLGEDLGAWDDGDMTWDGYLLYEFPSGFDGKLGFDFYLRADHIGSDSWYKFRINES